MARWAPWGATKKFQVKLKSMKLQLHGFDIDRREQLNNKKNKNRDEAPTMATAPPTATMGIEAIWKGPKSGFVSFHRKLNQVRNFSQQKRLCRTQIQVIEWGGEEDEFENICSLQIASSAKEEKTSVVTHSFHPWHVSFRLLLSGEKEEVSSRDKMRLFGKGSLNLGSLASKWLLQAAEIEEEVPIHLLIDGLADEATLSVTVSFTEIRSSHSRANSQDSMDDVVSGLDVQRQSLMRRVKSQGHRPRTEEPEKKHRSKSKMAAGREVVGSSSNSNSDESATFDSSSGYVVVTNSGKSVGSSNSVVELDRSSSSSEAQLALIKKMAFWKWKRRRSSFKMTNNVDVADDKSGAGAKQGATDQATKEAAPISGTWQVRELVSRDDGKTKLKANVYFASYDQRSEKAAGESACTAIVAVIAHWLHQNPETMPTSEHHLNNLIIEGSSEWRKLCDHEAHKHEFPDRHFDIETIEAAGIRPIMISKEKSFHGLFNPEKFDCLKEMESFDKIWDKINENAEGEFGSSRVYIISWNDHFFILKMEADANYIIDSLGERLYEGCNQAYILKFDESTVMYGRVEKKVVNGSGEEVKEGEKGTSNEEEKEEDVMICRGKECCKEYMKRFLAGIQLRELEEQEEKGIRNDPLYLCQRLQIDFHYTTTDAKAGTAAVSGSPDSPLLLNGELRE